MKRLKLIVICIGVLKGCSKSAERQIVDKMTVINSSTDFDFFKQVLNENEILILGEASHGDGKTFEIKSDMVKYLIENFGYNTIAFEARDFLEMEIINGRIEIDSLAEYLDHDNWVRQWSPWGPAQQIEILEEVTKNNKSLKYIGLEPFANKNLKEVLFYLNKEFTRINAVVFDSLLWDTIKKTHLNLFYGKSNLISNDDYKLYLDYLNTNYSFLKQIDDTQKNDHILFLIQSVENLLTFVKIVQVQSSGLSEDEILNKTINLRDKQMAENLIWHKRRNPDAKIIVWMANFHGARDLKDIFFANGEPERYKKFNVFGEHISNTFGDRVFSIAFTSSEGISKMPYDFEGIEEKVIYTNDNTLEKVLGSVKSDFGFINFREIRNIKPSLANTYFNSIMLGHVNQKGKWLNAFDGVFFIKKQEVAIPIK
ncbi:erythromycin esterase family protein [uncultured Planktosalinus sp.]|mgnify:CR=1 FL=1|uniref:erythromycin esterase family protein n=1 Tax=uncultured Planktosalinus sp. TaxID=1810935 RepID=UPI0030D773D9